MLCLFQGVSVEAWMMLCNGKGTKTKSCVFAVVVMISIIVMITVLQYQTE